MMGFFFFGDEPRTKKNRKCDQMSRGPRKTESVTRIWLGQYVKISSFVRFVGVGVRDEVVPALWPDLYPATLSNTRTADTDYISRIAQQLK